MKKILVAIDGSEYSERALAKAKEIAEAFNSQVTLINVINIESIIANLRYARTDIILNWPELTEEAETKAQELLGKSKKVFENLSEEVETVVLDTPTGNIAKAIADYVDDEEHDLIIMGSHGMGSLIHRLSLGSVTNKVLHLVSKPILIVQ